MAARSAVGRLSGALRAKMPCFAVHLTVYDEREAGSLIMEWDSSPVLRVGIMGTLASAALRASQRRDEHQEERSMAIPNFQTMMLPVLECLADGQEHAVREVTEAVFVYIDLCNEGYRGPFEG